MLKIDNQNSILIAKFSDRDRLNSLIADEVKTELKECFSSSDGKLVLDMTGIKYIDSTGFGVFLAVLKTANSNSGQFKIANISPHVMELFKLLQLHNVFELYNSVDEAVNSFN